MFATGTAHRAGPEGELRHGRNLADSAAAAGVPHLVYGSGDGAAPDSPVPLFRVKDEVEQYIRSLPIAATILAPVYFMENLFNPWNVAALQAGVLPSPIAVDLPLQQAAIADVASVAALAIERPEESAGRRIRVASDELTAADAADALMRVTGRPFTANRVAMDGLASGLRSLFAWLERTGHDVDIPGLHGRYPQVGWHTYEQWLRSERPRLAALCPEQHVSAN
jgi:uncharacterized protein YbjT (DUF2867 family)